MNKKLSGNACLLLALITGHVAARAADWRMHIASAEAVVMVDAATVKREGALRALRTVIFTGHADAHGVIGYAAMLQLECVARTSQTIELSKLYADGSSKPDTDDQGSAQPIQVDSFLSVLHERACKPAGKSDDMGGVALNVAPAIAARSVFGLLKLGLDSAQASELASYRYGNAAEMEIALDNANLAGRKRLAARQSLAAQLVVAPKPPPPIVPLRAAVESGRVGRYSASEREMAAGIWLKADGTFEYGLTVGSLDESAKGRWTANGRRIRLMNQPRPVSPVIAAGPGRRDPDTLLSLHVLTPNGSGVPGVDLVVGFDGGATLEGYTQASGWKLPADEKRVPRWVQFSMSSYGLSSPRFKVDTAAANGLTFVLTPNDIGQVDFTDLVVEADQDQLVIHRAGGEMRFTKGQ